MEYIKPYRTKNSFWIGSSCGIISMNQLQAYFACQEGWAYEDQVLSQPEAAKANPRPAKMGVGGERLPSAAVPWGADPLRRERHEVRPDQPDLSGIICQLGGGGRPAKPHSQAV